MSYAKDDYEKMVGEQAFLDNALISLGHAAVARAVLGNSSLQYQLGHAVGEIAVQLLQERRQHQRTGVAASYEQLREAHSLISGERLDVLRVTGQTAYEAWRELPSTKRDYQKTMSWQELHNAEQDEWASIERAVVASLTGPKKPTKPAEANANDCPVTPCCNKAAQYNGFGSDGPKLFECPKGCACHD